MKIKALKTFYADFFQVHITEGETVAIKEFKDEKKTQQAKRMVKNYIDAGLVEKVPNNATVGLQKTKKGVEILKEAKVEADKIAEAKRKAAHKSIGKVVGKASKK